MAQNKRGDEKQLRKDQQVRRELRQEVGEEIRSSDSQPLIRRPNRDQARGDSDRSRDHRNGDTSWIPDDQEKFDERS